MLTQDSLVILLLVLVVYLWVTGGVFVVWWDAASNKYSRLVPLWVRVTSVIPAWPVLIGLVLIFCGLSALWQCLVSLLKRLAWKGERR